MLRQHVIFLDRLNQHLNSNDRSSSYLNFFFRRIWEFFLVVDFIAQAGFVFKYAQVAQDLWNSIIGKHCQFFFVLKSLCMIDVAEGTDEICAKDLGALVEENLFSFVDGFVSETRKVLYNHIYQSWAVISGLFHEFQETLIIFYLDNICHFVNDPGPFTNQTKLWCKYMFSEKSFINLG